MGDQLWVREVRKRTAGGRQIAIISTGWQASMAEIAGPQFGRWYQENFFKYGRQHFDLDRLIDYQLEPIDGSTRVVNPTWRRLDGEIRSRAAKQVRRKAKLHDLTLKGKLTPGRAEHYRGKAEELLAEIDQEAAALDGLKAQRRETSKHVAIEDLPEEERFMKLATPKANGIFRQLCTELNATETIYPDTDLRLIFKSVSE